jgi:hypothetical protein
MSPHCFDVTVCPCEPGTSYRADARKREKDQMIKDVKGSANNTIIPTVLHLLDHVSGVDPVKCEGIVSGRSGNRMNDIKNGIRAIIKPDLP